MRRKLSARISLREPRRLIWVDTLRMERLICALMIDSRSILKINERILKTINNHQSYDIQYVIMINDIIEVKFKCSTINWPYDIVKCLLIHL